MKDCLNISNEAFTKILNLKNGNTSYCIALYNFLLLTRDEEGFSHVSYNDIIKNLRCGRSKISQTIKDLENLGVIKYDRPSQLTHKTNTFSFPFQEVEHGFFVTDSKHKIIERK